MSSAVRLSTGSSLRVWLICPAADTHAKAFLLFVHFVPTLRLAQVTQTMPTTDDAFDLYDAGDLDPAAEICRALLEKDPASFPALYLLGTILGEQLAYEDAIACLDQAVELRPDVKVARFNLASIFAKFGKFDAALLHIVEALRLDPNDVEARLIKASCHIELGQRELAVTEFRYVLEIDPACTEALRHRATMLAAEGRNNEALADLDRLMALNGAASDTCFTRGTLLLDIGRFDDAAADFTRAIVLKPDYAAAYSNRGLALAGMNRHEEALVDFKRAISLKPDYVAAWSNYGLSLGLLKRSDEAMRDESGALEIDPTDSHAYFNRGVAHDEKKEFDGPARFLKQSFSMKRIIYLSPFPVDNISGGIKVMFGHVAMLNELGYDACVFSPSGRPVWFSNDDPLFSGSDLFSNPDHLVVFPELLNGRLSEWALAEMKASKLLLCQNQYYMFSEALQARPLHELGFVHFLTVGQVARGFLQRVFAPAAFDVVPTWIDDTHFRPREKTPSIALFPRKMPQSYELIRHIFCTKYPQLKTTPWWPIQEMTEQMAADILGQSSVFLSLCDRECCPLSPLEAMASGCAVAGFHGYGGLEYATAENGIWLPPDHLEETADALAELLLADARHQPRILAMRAKGYETARQFTRARTMVALDRIFGPLAK